MGQCFPKNNQKNRVIGFSDEDVFDNSPNKNLNVSDEDMPGITTRTDYKSDTSQSGETKWKKIPTLKNLVHKYILDGTLTSLSDSLVSEVDPCGLVAKRNSIILNESLAFNSLSNSLLQLRMMLDEPIAQARLGSFAKSIYSQESFFAWTDIKEYRAIPTQARDYRRVIATHIYEKYIKRGAISEVGGIGEDLKADMEKYISKIKNREVASFDSIFDEIGRICLKEIHDAVWVRFKTTLEYDDIRSILKKEYNRVSSKDFEYIAKLGVGGFSRVIHVRKKSTGRQYVMKVQLKTALLTNFEQDLTQLNIEKNAFACCRHPFIINLAYAFQNQRYAILVLDLSTVGDLQDMLNDLSRFDETSVRFYSAQIALAIAHLHDLEMIYRDLKPCNILLLEDGYVQLADMGLVARYQSGPEAVKRTTIVGTKGYIAPEILNMNSSGYTNAVDYWSFGATMFKLFTGAKPFDSEDDCDNGEIDVNKLYNNITDKELTIPEYVSNDGKNIITALLAKDNKHRLGCSGGGVNDLKSHAFYSDIDWTKLLLKQLEPPFIPKVNTVPGKKCAFKNIDSALESFHREFKDGRDWRSVPSKEGDENFASWDFISPHSLKVEMGIAQEMIALESDFKARKMMGS